MAMSTTKTLAHYLNPCNSNHQIKIFAETSLMPGAPEAQELLHYILYQKATEKLYPNGVRDKGRDGQTLDYFLNVSGYHPTFICTNRATLDGKLKMDSCFSA